MKRDYRLYLDDMLEAIGKIERYTKGLSYEQFRKDDKTIDAIITNFAIIGEAAATQTYDRRALGGVR